jgi:hypothetical protein
LEPIIEADERNCLHWFAIAGFDVCFCYCCCVRALTRVKATLAPRLVLLHFPDEKGPLLLEVSDDGLCSRVVDVQNLGSPISGHPLFKNHRN